MAEPDSKPPRRKRLLQNLGLSVGTFLACVALLEGVLRLCGYGNLEIYEPDPGLYWKLKPNQDCYTKIDHKPVHINSLGTRGPEFTPAKPAGVERVLSLGDSRTFGWGLTDAETYSRSLERLQAEKQTATIQVINAGVNAWSYPQMGKYFRDTALAYHPDVVILGEANLWTQFSETNDPAFVKKFMWRVRLKNFLRRFAIYHYIVEAKLKDFYERHRSKFIPVDPAQDPLFKEQQKKDPGELFRKSIEALCDVAASNQVKVILLYLPTLDDLSATNTALPLQVKRDVSESRHVPLVDLSPEIRAGGGKALYLDADPVHFNARGNALIAQRLADTMNSIAPR